MEADGILIYAELDKENKLKPVVKELLTKASELKQKLWNQRVYLCIIGPRIKYDEIIKEAGEYGSDLVIIVSDDRLKEYNPVIYGEIFTEIAKKYPPRIILFGATYKGKETAAYTASKLKTGLTADCTGLDISDDGLLISTRPTYGGRLEAEIICKTFPQCATVREHNFTAEKHPVNVYAIFDWKDIDDIENKITLIKSREKKSKFRDLSDAKIIISGGKGACKDNGFALIYMLAQKLNAAVGGSREAYEQGYITKSQQIGQTGITVAPDVYISVGISGANQHLAAIKNSKKIIAINSDKNAPVFKSADIGIVGDLFEVLPELISSLDSNENKEEQNE